MKYKVLRYFTDLQDNDFAYKAGDIFPREGKSVSQARLDELSGSSNKQGRPLIEVVDESPGDNFSQYMNEPEEGASPKYSRTDISRMNKAELQRVMRELGVNAPDMSNSKMKQEIINRLGL